MEKKYQIFISSTYEDLIEERRKVQDTILSMYQFPIGMEMFSADDKEQWEIIQETIDSSDYYVLIIGHRYGSIIKNGEDAGISYTQKEFRYALKQNIPVLAFLINDSVPVVPQKVDEDAKSKKKLKAFKEEVKVGRNVEWWTSKEDLALKVMNSLNKKINRGNRPGWVRANGLKLEETQAEFVEMSKENRRLREENERLRKNAVVRKPDFEITINDSNCINGIYKDISQNSLIKKFKHIDIEEFKNAGLAGGMSQKNIDKYNEIITSYKSLKEGLKEYVEYRNMIDNIIPFSVKIKNTGSCKANDVYIRIEALDGIRILTGPQIWSIRAKLAKKAETPTFFDVDMLKGYSDISKRVSNQNPECLSSNSEVDVQENCMLIKIKELLHTVEYISGTYYLIPSEKGIYEINVSIVCEEFTEEDIQKLNVIIE